MLMCTSDNASVFRKGNEKPSGRTNPTPLLGVFGKRTAADARNERNSNPAVEKTELDSAAKQKAKAEQRHCMEIWDAAVCLLNAACHPF